jgi:protein gp37
LIGLYPNGFKPELHRSRLGQPGKVRKPSKIFVCSMGDLLGDGVAVHWVSNVIAAAAAAPRHTFIFLTKRPDRYPMLKWPENSWLGATVTDQPTYDDIANSEVMHRADMRSKVPVKFMCAEPLLGPIVLDDRWIPDWIIIGPMTEPGAERHACEQEIDMLTEQARELGIPVFHKGDCGPLKLFPSKSH